tara:strand:- start:576 stop:890 length:315 start_codon:yes stop_codon:yes gene_type:complete
MNKILTVLALTATISFNATANESTDICVTYSDAATAVMTARQANRSVAELYKLVDGNKLMLALIKEAYNKPFYSTETYKQREINTFTNDVFLICINELGDKEDA